MTRYFKVRDFEKSQHYTDRTPPWIKFYNATLDDYTIAQLPDAAKAHLFSIWLLASRHENHLPYDPKWIAQCINAKNPVDLEALAKRGLIIETRAKAPAKSQRTRKHVASKPQAARKQNAKPEREGEKETEPEGETEQNAAGAAPVSSSQEVELFRRGKDLLGKNAGGLIKQVLAAKAGNVALARSALETASTKQDPKEYLGAVIRGGDRPGQEYGVDYW